jgi:EmrB/QacA subfamily drug resistance transporter
MASTTPAAPKPGGKLSGELITLAIVLVVGGVAPQIDTTVVNVGLHAVASGLGTGVDTVQWVATAYLLALGVTVPIAGWASARWGGRNVWLGSLGLFLLGSVLAGAAPNIGLLIAFRVVQGVAAGICAPLLLTLLLQAAGDRPLGRLITVITIVVVVVPIAGPVIGGVIVQTLNWRWLFFVNVPVTIAAIILAWWRLRDPGERKPLALDIPGLLLLSPSLALILFALSAASGAISGHDGFGQAAVLVPLVIGLALGAAFVLYAVRRGAAAIVDLSVLRHRQFASGATLLGLSGLSLYGAMLLLPLYQQILRGNDALVAGLLLAPQGIGALLARPVGPLVDRVGARPIVFAATGLSLLGTIPYALSGAGTSEWLLAAALVVRGTGLSAANIAMLAGSLQGLPPAERGPASAITRIVQYVGGAFGTSVLATILAQAIASHPHTVAGTAAAFDVTFWWSIAFTALAVIPAFFVPGKKRVPA